jgi:hypothetical protein
MKNILAENLLRFGVKNLNHVDKAVVEHLMEVNPAGSTVSPETQAKIDAMIAASEALIAPIKGLGFVGTGQAAGTTQKVSQVKLGKVKDSTEVYVAVYWGSSSIVTYYFGALNGKPVVSSWEINGKYQSQAKPITAASVFEIGVSQGKWVGDYLAYNKNAKQWQTVADAITAVANKYIATGIATNESRIYEIAPAGGTLSPGAQETMDKLIAETQAIVSKYINSSLKLDLKGGGPIAVLKATVGSRQNLSSGGISVDVQWNIKDQASYYSQTFPIYSVDGTKPAGYYGKDAAAGKTLFDTQFQKNIQQYWQTQGANYEACKQGIWNGILAVADKYTKSGVATK